jgi:hypothetical protein
MLYTGFLFTKQGNYSLLLEVAKEKLGQAVDDLKKEYNGSVFLPKMEEGSLEEPYRSIADEEQKVYAVYCVEKIETEVRISKKFLNFLRLGRIGK